jgi:hypothetical protein
VELTPPPSLLLVHDVVVDSILLWNDRFLESFEQGNR